MDKIKYVDFHCDGRFPEGKAIAASFAMLSPGSKALANPLGVAASIPINRNPVKYDYNKFHLYLILLLTTATSEKYTMYDLKTTDYNSKTILPSALNIYLLIQLSLHSFFNMTLKTLLVKWKAISEDSCGKTKYARPHRQRIVNNSFATSNRRSIDF